MKKVEISHKTIIFTVFLLLGLYLVYIIRDILFGIFIAIMLMAAISPIVTKLEKWRIPRVVSIWIVYICLIGAITTIIAGIVPPLINQTVALVSKINVEAIQEFIQASHVKIQDLQVLTNHLNSIPKVFNVVTSTFSLIITIVTLLVMTFYLLIERQKLHIHLKWFFGEKEAEKRAEIFVNKVEKQIGQWVRGELTLMLVIGILTYIGLLLLGIDYALPLALVAGMLEILPNLGPTISAIPAIIVAYITVSTPMAVAVTALYILIQQIENSFIVPQIMKSAVGINPILTIILLLVGFRLGGVAGAALAIPIFLVIKVVATEFYHFKQLNKSNKR